MTSDEKNAPTSCFEEIFNSKAIAVIGSSNNPNRLGFKIVKNLLDQQKEVYPINPNINQVLNQKTYPSVKDVPNSISLAVIILSPKYILNAIRDCGIKGIKYVIIIAEGFREIGPEGARLQDTLKNLLNEYKIRALGPNTIGVHDTLTPISISFLDVRDLKQGNISISSQTGLLAGALLKYMNLTKNIGVNRVIDLGNMIDLNHTDVLEFLMDDQKTEVIAMHIEGISNGQKFSQVLKRATSKKPVIVLKGGAMPETRRVVESHTGSLVGDDKVFDGILKKAGAIRVKDFEEFVDVMKGFSYMEVPKGNKIAVITGSGGAAVITIDSLLRLGLGLAGFSNHTLEALREYIPEQGKILNPVDIWPAGVQYGLETIYSRVISILSDDPDVDAIIVLLFIIKDFKYESTSIIKAAQNCSKPIFFAIQGHAVNKLRDEFEINGLPTYVYGGTIAKVLNYMFKYKITCG